MIHDPNGPADTTMMRIVHDALRRDLRRVQQVLSGESELGSRQLSAVTGQLRWMMEFLEAHHRLEDHGLYPAVRAADPASAPLLDEMASDHQAVMAGIDAVRVAALEPDPSAGRLAEAVARLAETLLPHLRREEEVAMPVVSRAITNAEWQAIEQANLDRLPVAELAREGHWLIDDADPDDRALVLGLVPPLQRVLLLYGFGYSYRRRRLACWTPERRIPTHGAVDVLVEADVDAVWSIVSDPTRVDEWSHECVACEWVGGYDRARTGARFRGRNRHGLTRWGRLCEIVRVDPFVLVWRTVPTRLYPDSTEWTIRLTPHEGGTRIEQSYEVLKGSALEPLYATLIPAHRDRLDALRRDLDRIGRIALKARRADHPALPADRADLGADAHGVLADLDAGRSRG